MIFLVNGETFTLNPDDSKNGFHCPQPGANDSELTCTFSGGPHLNGSHVGCRVPLQQPIDSSHNGTITVIGMFKL